jgi:predicted nucleic acid-binding Zn ribbon protein
MTTSPDLSNPARESERAADGAMQNAVVGSTGKCPICGKLLAGRQKRCSARCRAALSRRKRVALPVAEAKEIRAKLAMILDAAWEAKATLEKYGGG